MLHKYLLVLMMIFTTTLKAQTRVSGVITDALNNQPLPYATVRIGNTTQGAIADINGVFNTILPAGVTELHISYAGYITSHVSYPFADTLPLQRAQGSLEEVVIRPPYDKIKRIVNLAIDNKKNHNPDKLDQYSCHVYYKMNADLIPAAAYKADDSTIAELKKFIEDQHILFGETYSQRSYRKTDKLQETILASRLSGFQKTYFTNLVTGLLPFHVYSDVIMLNGTNYIHPVANGWQSRYEFDLEEELLQNGDTTFILSYRPKKGVHFSSLRGVVYINSNGYAISHITTNSIDSNHQRYMKMEQNYQQIEGRWFPAELNYDFVFQKYPSNKIGMRMSGHSVVSRVSFADTALERYSKAYPVRLHDSVDLRDTDYWNMVRGESLTSKEQVTYVFMDSIMQDMGMDKFTESITYAAATGRLPVKFVDIDLGRLYSYNAYEKSRLGLGLYTNDRLTKHLHVGGWFGYGFNDKEWKWGASARIYPMGNKEHFLEIAYYNTYQNTGNVNIHRELDNNYYRNLLLNKVDRIAGGETAIQTRLGYLEAKAKFKLMVLSPQYDYAMGGEPTMRNYMFDVMETSVNLRYAYAEKRAPVLGYYFPVSTRYPILYVDVANGNIRSYGLEINYVKVVSAVTYTTHVNRWGKDVIRAEGGLLYTNNDLPLPRSFLLAANGYRATNNYLYVYGGFATMFPYAYFNDRYASLLYRHDFDRMLYKTKFSCPQISVAHNMLYGKLSNSNVISNGDIATSATGYHESGLMLNRLLRVNYLNLAYLDLNAGAFYHWDDPFNWKTNGTFVFGLGFGL